MLAAPVLSQQQRSDFDEGRSLFNAGSYWHAHESWERVWLAMGNGDGDDAEIILRGLIQLAAALHLSGIGRMDGSMSNFRKAEEKLAIAPRDFLGIDIPALVGFIRARRSGDASIVPPPV
ncbi:MAG: hypothetical protein JWQ98_1021 [Chlorobi bacterium]|nr:hypothetical protein [Chlorobiota bacterium]